jgi:NH3-dependent NAD+ synthetase
MAQAFLKEKMLDIRRGGIIVPISGGLDSNIVSCRFVNAVGRNMVTGPLLPE